MKRPLIAGFFILFLLVGLWVFDDYGISWDERISRNHGYYSTAYVFDKWLTLIGAQTSDSRARAALLHQSSHGYYGVVVEAPLYIFEKLLGLEDPRDIYFMRHLLTFFLFYVGVYFFYLIALKRYGDWRFGLLGCVFLVLTPRIFANGFYNSKDLVFMSFFIFNLYTLLLFAESRSMLTAGVHAAATAVLVGTRIMGVIIPIFTVAFYVIASLRESRPKLGMRNELVILFCYLVFAAALTIMVWPALWEDPIENFKQAFLFMGQVTWDNSVRYMGEFIKATELPWHYTPVWLVITTPLLYSGLFSVGTLAIMYQLIRSLRSIRCANLQIDLLFLGTVILPIMFVIVLNPTIYDGWRHLYFIYPGMLLVALRGITAILKLPVSHFTQRTVNVGLTVMITVTLSGTLYFMFRYHPHQNVYFNVLPKATDFELDYWGLSYRQALQYLAKVDARATIKIANRVGPVPENLMMLPDEDRDRFESVPLEQAEYYLSNYRFPQDWERYEDEVFPFSEELYTIIVAGTPIVGIYRINENTQVR